MTDEELIEGLSFPASNSGRYHLGRAWATKGVFVTTSSFSHQALEFVRHLAQRVILIDGQRLADLMIEHNVGVRVSRALEFKRLDEDFFAEEDWQ
jgi:restriction system protein